MPLPPAPYRPLRSRRRPAILANAVVLAALAAAVLSLAGCGARRAAPERAGAAPAEVAVATFAAGHPGVEVVLPGRIKAAEEVTLAARISARLTSLPAREGRHVRQGDPIAIFAAPETQRALAAARAELSSAELSEAVAARQEARVESLFVARVVSERDREVASDGRRSAEARLEAARAALDALASGVTVRAPFDGVVVRVHADPGADLAAGSPLVELRSNAGLEVLAEVPEDAVGRLSSSTVTVQIGDGPWRPARLARLEGMTDWRSRSRTAHLAFDGDAEPGAYARVSLAGGAVDADAGTVPVESLVARGALAGVFVIEGGQARLRWLKLGRTQNDRVEVLAGLEAGERFALSPRTLVDGRAVKVRS
jgi:RND family efflux transporter MFP subunit